MFKVMKFFFCKGKGLGLMQQLIKDDIKKAVMN